MRRHILGSKESGIPGRRPLQSSTIENGGSVGRGGWVSIWDREKWAHLECILEAELSGCGDRMDIIKRIILRLWLDRWQMAVKAVRLFISSVPNSPSYILGL